MEDFDLEELEVRLYGQVFHSVPDECEQNLPSTTIPSSIPISQENDTINRQVSTYSISNVVQRNKNRYWIDKPTVPHIVNDLVRPDLQTADNKVEENVNNVNEIAAEKFIANDNNLNNLNVPILLLEKKKVNKKKRYRKQKKKKKKLLNPFNSCVNNLNNDNMVCSTEPQHCSNLINNDVWLNKVVVIGLPPVAPKPVVDEKNLNETDVKILDVAKDTKEQIIILSDSDNESTSSVEIIPQKSPIVIVVDSDEEKTKDCGDILKNVEDEKLDVPKNNPVITSNCQVEYNCDNAINVETLQPPEDINLPSKNIQEVLTEAERCEMLQTPDSSMNDFIDSDVLLDKQFNFNLHGSDLNLSDKGFVKPSKIVSNPTDIYETESSCSGSGTPTKSSTYNDHVTNTPAKDIFQEPDLVSFSNFITPNREKGKKRKNDEETEMVQTKALEAISKNIELEDKSEKIDNKKSKKKKNKIKEIDSTVNVPMEEVKKTKLEKRLKLIEKAFEKKKKQLLKKKYMFNDKTYNKKFERLVRNYTKRLQKTESNPHNVEESSSDSIIEVDENVEQREEDNPIIFADDDNSSFMLITDKEPENIEQNIVLNVNNPSTSKVSNVEQENLMAEDGPSTSRSILNVKKRFRDFWSPDMNTFYDKSWGEEYFDIDKVLQSLSPDSSKWKIIDEDKSVFKNLDKRKFCILCKKLGHIKYDCPQLHKKDIKCSLCGHKGHFHMRCRNLVCTSCGQRGQYFTSSCNKCAHYGRIQCFICKMYGHPGNICPDLWRRYHSTINQNSLPTALPLKLKPTREQWCSGCARRGHLFHNCQRITREHFATLPNIISYEPTYIDKILPPLLPTPVNVETSVPNLNNVSLETLRKYKDTIISNNHQKYLYLIRSLIKRCQKGPVEYLDQLRYLERSVLENNFENKKIGLIYRIRKMIIKYENTVQN